MLTQKMKTSFLILLSVIFFTSPGYTQAVPPKITMNIGYHGNNIWNPGFNIGLDYIHGIESGNSRNGEPYIRHKFFNADLGFYADPGSYRAVFTHLGINHRKFQENKLNFNIGFSPVGLFRSFIPETNEAEEVDGPGKIPVAEKWYYAPVVSLGMGKFRNNKPGTGWFFEIDIMTLIPYDRSVLPLLNTKIGWRMRIV